MRDRRAHRALLGECLVLFLRRGGLSNAGDEACLHQPTLGHRVAVLSFLGDEQELGRRVDDGRDHRRPAPVPHQRVADGQFLGLDGRVPAHVLKVMVRVEASMLLGMAEFSSVKCDELEGAAARHVRSRCGER
ncbi:hypothetical protein [Streptomyces sp. NPDC051572]|uniref:hypothetical protein n=1 Tax=Streptomyces sp. NPDC051572 TaxID=3155802 RepID=UPI003450FC4C